MPNITLHASTGVEQVDQIITGIIQLFELGLPQHIHSYYLCGSYADHSAVLASDIDLTLVAKGSLDPTVEEQFAQIRDTCKLISPCALDIGLDSEDVLIRTGDVSLKLASVLLYGDDIRPTVTLVPLAQYTREAMHFPYRVFRGMRRNLDLLTFPLDYPDPTTEFFGYARRRLHLRDGTTALGTKQLLLTTAFIARALLAHQAGQYTGSKRDCIVQYRRWINDEWAILLEEIDRDCRTRWSYLIPSAEHDRQSLRALCERTLAFENHFLELYKAYLLAELEGGDEEAQLLATQRLGQLVYHDPAIATALQQVALYENDRVRQAGLQTSP